LDPYAGEESAEGGTIGTRAGWDLGGEHDGFLA
jgi:hypothetical protein